MRMKTIYLKCQDDQVHMQKWSLRMSWKEVFNLKYEGKIDMYTIYKCEKNECVLYRVGWHTAVKGSHFLYSTLEDFGTAIWMIEHIQHGQQCK